MKKEKNALYILRLAVTLLAICAAVALALAGVNAITKDRIAAIQAEKTQKAIAEVLKDGETAVRMPILESTHPSIVSAYENENGYAVQVAPAGFGGTITMMVGIDLEGKVLGISVITHTESAGLGAVAAANNSAGQSFRDQFVGQSGSVSVTKDGGDIDAITNATITSRAICDGVNAALACIAGLG